MTISLLSAGIDIGTTTTHLTISRLTLENRSPATQIPRLVVSAREILYESPVRFTPLKANGGLDEEALRCLLEREYASAGVNPAEVTSGAAIITGESAALANAADVVRKVAAAAGDFVVAIAGHQMESILSARGSGAVTESHTTGKTICNIDIGGGTSNYAVVKEGRVVDTTCLGIGGRFLRFDSEQRLQSITESGETFIDGVAKSHLLKLNERPDCEHLELFANLLAEVIVSIVARKSPPQIAQRILYCDQLRHDYKIDEVWISGGVGQVMFEMDLGENNASGIAGVNEGAGPDIDLLRFSDMGIYLAQALQSSLGERGIKYVVPESPIRATVLGAGNHSLQISGSTITACEKLLPLRGVPIVRLWQDSRGLSDEDCLLSKISDQCAIKGLDWKKSAIAIALPHFEDITAASLRRIATTMASAKKKLSSAETPLVLLTGQDIAAALGQMLKSLGTEPVMVIDGVATDDGDYVDIGQPIPGQNAIPVVIKTLIFRH